ncbi:hypothetical protein AM499_04430 [Bacillus sp. FJAT-22090]|uniref:hypothetical protein n=1 Tax=Bacillus sp. FJAT-22090 TaxID=1581038 RepID=UPI0006AF0B51|nr:hypothetical protein [Bacillus sp. FJAT-22090]ALC85144.1 hypothetical protein AM499_04430 [Bacillus sp. FJAT-22090]
MKKKIYSFLSALFLILMVSPLIAISFLGQRSDAYLEFIWNISFYLPIIWGFLGLLFGVIGVKGNVRISLVFANIIILCFWTFITFAGLYGFKQP